MPDPEMGTVPMHNVVPRLSASPGALRLPAPELGQHTEEILTGLGPQRRRCRAAERPRAPCEAAGKEGWAMRTAPPAWRSLLYVPAHVDRFVHKAHSPGRRTPSFWTLKTACRPKRKKRLVRKRPEAVPGVGPARRRLAGPN